MDRDFGGILGLNYNRYPSDRDHVWAQKLYNHYSSMQVAATPTKPEEKATNRKLLLLI